MNKTQQDYYDNIIDMIELQQSLLTEGINNFKQNKQEIDRLRFLT
jgi:dsDNA-binding SOS-regulon protein